MENKLIFAYKEEKKEIGEIVKILRGKQKELADIISKLVLNDFESYLKSEELISGLTRNIKNIEIAIRRLKECHSFLNCDLENTEREIMKEMDEDYKEQQEEY